MASPQPTPALPPPPGQTSNFANPESLSKWTILCVTICLSLTGIVFLLRSYVRVFIKRQWILEDYMCCTSWAGLVVSCGLLITIMYKHGGVHEWDLTTAQVRNVSYWFYVARVNYGLTIMFTKLAILLLYRRVFLPQRWSTFDVITRLYLLIICLFYIASTAVKIWECTPRQRVWDKSQKGTCIDISRLLNASGLFNTISDVLILLVPVKSVWKLHMDRGRKVACVLLFTVGLIAPVFSIIGFVVRVRISANPDISYTQPEILLWSAAEISTGIICICLPTLGALAQHRHHRPSSTILNGKFHSRSTRCSGPNPLTSSFNERDVFSNEYLELRENKPGRSDPTSKYAVFTAIRGGPSTPHSGMEEPRSSCECRGPEIYTTMLSDEEKCSEAAAAPDAGGIMKSYRIEQSYS